jgi:hypothetical protein
MSTRQKTACCDACGKAGASKKCSQCSRAQYCDRECQHAHWKAGHKRECKTPAPKNMEQKAHQHEQRTLMKADEVEGMNLMMQMLMSCTNGPAKDMMEFYMNNTPPVHEEFKRRFQEKKCFYPAMMDHSAFQVLNEVYHSTRGLYCQEMLLVTPGDALLKDQSTLFKRLGNNFPETIRWFLHSSIGDVRRKGPEEFAVVAKHTGYDYVHMHHSFSNARARSELLRPGTVHVAVGFVDLSLLLWMGLEGSSSCKEALHWVGYEASAFSVAKTLVVGKMLELDCAVDSILQVWYSSAWCASTLVDFRAALCALEGYKDDETVTQLLGHWRNNARVPLLVDARREWLQSFDMSLFSGVLNALQETNRAHLADYFLTGQLLDATVGSVTMFGLPENCKSARARNESVFHSMDYHQLLQVAHTRTKGDLVNACVVLLREKIARLLQWVWDGQVRLTIQPPTVVSIQNRHIIDEIHAWKPWTMSWNNVCDYMPVEMFHTMARRCSSAEDTVHFAYSMNWPTVVKGAFSLDYESGESMKMMLEQARESLTVMYTLDGSNRVFRCPPVDNPMNVLDVMYRLVSYKKWLADFFHGVDNVAQVEPSFFNILARANSSLFITWSYDESVKFKATIPSSS